MRRHIAIAVTGLAVLGCLAGCVPTTPPPPTTSTTETTPTPTPTPTPPPTFDPPSAFDLTKTVRLTSVDRATSGILDGATFYALVGDTLWAVDVRTGATRFGTVLSQAAWACPSLVADASRVYVTATNFVGDPAAVVPVTLTAVNKSDGSIAWSYSPPDVGLPAGADCPAIARHPATTLTDAGLLLSLDRTDAGTGVPWTGARRASLLNPATGTVSWSVDADVLATPGAAYGVAAATGPQPGPEVTLQASPINLATGEIGSPLTTDPSGAPLLASSFALTGLASGNLVLIGQSQAFATPTDQPSDAQTGTPTAPPPTSQEPPSATPSTGDVPTPTAPLSPVTESSTIVQVRGSDGTVVSGSAVTTTADIGDCRLAGASMLVCRGMSDRTQAIAVALKDGATAWQRGYARSADDPAPLLFHGYVYGFDASTNASYVLDSESGRVVQQAAYPPPLAVDETGIVFSVTDAPSGPGWQCWWAPAID